MTSTRNEEWTLFKMVLFVTLTLCPPGEKHEIVGVMPDKELGIRERSGPLLYLFSIFYLSKI